MHDDQCSEPGYTCHAVSSNIAKANKCIGTLFTSFTCHAASSKVHGAHYGVRILVVSSCCYSHGLDSSTDGSGEEKVNNNVRGVHSITCRRYEIYLEYHIQKSSIHLMQ